jgi:hypothetical protein
MFGVLTIVWAGAIVAADPPPPSGATKPVPPPALWAEYDARKAKIGNSADAEVRLALWCEANGLLAQRHQHLARAVLIEPRNVLARGLLGLAAHRGRWADPEAVARAEQAEARQNAALVEYNARRDQLFEQDAAVRARLADMERRLRPAQLAASRARHATHRQAAQDRIKLGLWCEQAGLQAEAAVEFTTALRLDPGLETAWRHLGYVRQSGRWVPQAQAAAERAEDWAEYEATCRWVPLLRKWQAWLQDPRRRGEAETLLAKIEDPRTVVAVKRVFCDTPAIGDQARALRILRPIDSPASTRLVALLAAQSDFEEIQRTAVELLASRPRRDYVEPLVMMIHTPATYMVQPVAGPGSSGLLVVETPRYHLERSYDAPPAFALDASFHGYVGYDPNGLPIAMGGFELDNLRFAVGSVSTSQGAAGVIASGMRGQAVMAAAENRTAALLAAANLKAAAAQEQLAADIGDLNRSNDRAVALNARVACILEDTCGAPRLKDDEDAWRRWYFDRIGYNYAPPPKVYVTDVEPSLPPPILYSCFAAGTPVRARDGLRPIESIRPGDRVLCQDASTGALTFEPVLVAHHNPPSSTVQLTLDDGEVLVPSVYHRFWICGQGWEMARALKPGDALRIRGGRATVARSEPGGVVPVYNLDVASAHTFFVGARDCLVHDNTQPSPAVLPFDALAAPGSETAHEPR